MASSSGRTDSALEVALFERAFDFEFFQAVRLLARIFPERKTIGGSAKPSEEFVRFGAWLSLAFPASAVDYVERTLNGGAASHMTVTFLSLTGIQGVLPVYYTDSMLAARESKNGAFAEFFDIFNHRLVSLFYRAWQKHHPSILYETAARERREPDLFTHALFDLIGMGTGGLRGRMEIQDTSLLLYAGLIAQRPHSAAALRGILRDYFSVQIEIDQFIGNWYELDEADRCYLSPDSDRNQLGVAALLGSKVWDQQSRFKIRVGPLGIRGFADFLPDGAGLERLRQLTRLLAGQALAFDVQLSLCAKDVPEFHLTDQGALAPRLGWNSWLKTAEFQTNADDAQFTYLT